MIRASSIILFPQTVRRDEPTRFLVVLPNEVTGEGGFIVEFFVDVARAVISSGVNIRTQHLAIRQVAVAFGEYEHETI